MQPHGYGFSFLPAAGGTKIHNPHPTNKCRCRFRPAYPPPVLTERGVLQRPPDRPHEQASCTERTATECRSRKKSPPSNVLHALCNNLAPRRPAASSANSRAATCPPHRPHPKNRFCVTPASLPGTRQQPTNDATKPDGSPVVPQEHAATGRPMQRPRKRASPPPATHRHRPVAAETATLFRSSCPQPFAESFGTLRRPTRFTRLSPPESASGMSAHLACPTIPRKGNADPKRSAPYDTRPNRSHRMPPPYRRTAHMSSVFGAPVAGLQQVETAGHDAAHIRCLFIGNGQRRRNTESRIAEQEPVA